LGEKAGFGWVKVFGKVYDHDIVICKGEVLKRDKDLSARYRATYGHTPLSEDELRRYINLCSDVEVVIIGSGVYGALPITPEARKILDELRSRGIDVMIRQTSDPLISTVEEVTSKRKVLAIIHTTC